ncbi:MAG TPA: RIP metalloprotease RseP, partial [Cytophagales bacterium]|nr:RIP metalloprotease RseP [Cytophagales bacterium]
MEGMIMTAQLLLSLSILIAVHEWGHYITARMFNIRVEKFYLFFDFLFPMANVLNFSLFKYKKGDTEFGIGWFPLGGYVKIAGMVDESMDKEQMKQAPQPWEFRAKPAWQRLIVMLGGIIVNVITGVLIFVGLTYFLGDTYIPKDFINNNGGIQALELGEQIGFKTGDKIVKINGNDFADFQEVIKPDVLLSQDSYYTVLRDGQEVRIDIPSNFIENFNSKEAASNFLIPRIPAVVGRISKVAPYKVNDSTTVEKESISNKVGLKPGDKFLEVDGKPVTYQDEVMSIVKAGPRDSISFKIQRDASILTFTESFKGYDVIGFLPQALDKDQLAYVNYGIGESIGLGT